MQYLRLRFENASLYAEDHKKSSMPSGHSSLDYEFEKETDWLNPIGVNQLSNMLHVMFGLPPKPTYKQTVFNSIYEEGDSDYCKQMQQAHEHIYNMAKESYIRYDDYDPENYKANFEFVQTAKYKFNPNRPVSTVIDGISYRGHYTWDYFKRRFKPSQKHLYDKIMSFFSETLKVDDVRKHYYFTTFIEEFHKHLDDKNVKRFLKEDLRPNGEYRGANRPINTSLMDILSKRESTATTCDYSDRTPLLIMKGTGKKISFSGEIIVPMEDDDVEYLKENGVLPTLLDGGVVYVVNVSENPFYNGKRNLFRPIFQSQNDAQPTQQQEVM